MLYFIVNKLVVGVGEGVRPEPCGEKIIVIEIPPITTADKFDTG
jgi:hypothetical protein